MSAPAPLPTPPWLVPVPPTTGLADVDWVPTTVDAFAILAAAFLSWRIVRMFIFKRKNPMSDKLDALTAAVASLEAAVTVNSADIALAAQMFKDNAAASVQLAADEATIEALTARVAAATGTLVADDTSLKATTSPAPAPAA